MNWVSQVDKPLPVSVCHLSDSLFPATAFLSYSCLLSRPHMRAFPDEGRLSGRFRYLARTDRYTMGAFLILLMDAWEQQRKE